MARYEHLPLYKASIDLAVYIEQIVAGFSRYHKYTLGSELREQARKIVKLVVRANNAMEKKAILKELLDEQEEMKIIMRLSKEVKAFHSFSSFETGIRHLDNVIRQSAGWLRSQT
jgi:LEA14-like dessication related protein